MESGRWHRRAAEEAGSFSSSKSYLAHKNLRLAAKLSKSQGEVWEQVAETQEALSASLNKPVHASASPTSYQLSVEDKDLLNRKETYRTAFEKLVEDTPDAVGYAFVINGTINTADAYGSATLFRKTLEQALGRVSSRGDRGIASEGRIEGGAGKR
jgi:hypothetical protein